MAGTTSGNGNEDGRQHERSLWTEKVEHRFHIAIEQLQCETDGFQILKVPEHDRQPPEMFTPQEWRFGLHNLKGVDTVVSGSEALKLCVPLLFRLDEEQKWVKFCDDVVPEPKMMLACYGLDEDAIQLKEEDIKQLLAFDALCIALIIDFQHMDDVNDFLWRQANLLKKELYIAFHSNLSKWVEVFSYDLSRVENQIPFDLIKRAIMHIFNFTNQGYPLLDQSGEQFEADSYIENWMKAAVSCTALPFMRISDNFYADENSDLRLLESHHTLDGTYKVICGKNGLGREIEETQEEYIHIPSAMRLKDVGVKIKGEGGPLCNMSYNKVTKLLILPKMMIYGQSIAMIRNMARYEQYHVKVGNIMFRDYIFLIVDLIDTPEDMEYLTQCGVIHNACGSRALDMWKRVDQGLQEGKSSKEHNDMKREIRRRCDQRLPKLWSEFKILFCSKPWLIVPIIAATLLVAATLIQTYVAVIGSDRMIPRFRIP